jgi:predicted RNA binding protein YcfA (HicA-like mRNA interferase family)
MRITRATQDKLKAILESQGWTVRYEKGNFKGGYCIVHQQQTIIINKFHPLESKVNTLSEILRELEVDKEPLTPDQVRLVDRIKAEQV